MLARCVVEDGWPLRCAVPLNGSGSASAPPADGRALSRRRSGCHDRSLQPAASQPSADPNAHRTANHRFALRVNNRWGPARIGYRLGLHSSTVHRVLSRYALTRLSWMDRATSARVRRYEHAAAGDLVHVDIKKPGRLPDGGCHRMVGKARGNRNKTGTDANRRPGYAYLTIHDWPIPRSSAMSVRTPPPGSGNGRTPSSRKRDHRSKSADR